MPRIVIPLVLLESLALTPACKRAEESAPPAVESPATPAGEATSAEERGPAGPARLRHPAAAVTVDVPGAWKQEQDDASLTVISGDETVLLMFFAVEAADLEAAMTALDRELSASIQQSELSGFQEGQINGMTATMADGTGMMDGARVDLGIALILLPEGKVMIILGIANPSAPASTAREFSEIMASIRPEA
ncbi:MAG: hypothetical protein KC636_04355 [Myxococcales bacterium]|nr:hypothetical protein [Myxococcales bacterium]